MNELILIHISNNYITVIVQEHYIIDKLDTKLQLICCTVDV